MPEREEMTKDELAPLIRPLTMSCGGPVCRPSVRFVEKAEIKFDVIHILTLREGKKFGDYGWEFREWLNGMGLCCKRCIEFLDKDGSA